MRIDVSWLPAATGAVRRLYELKDRPVAKSAAVMFFDLAAALAALRETGVRTRAAMTRLLPGGVTLLFWSGLVLRQPPVDGRLPRVEQR